MQRKVVVIEFDKNDHPLPVARLLKVNNDGKLVETFKDKLKKRGAYLRYNYYTFDFSSVRENGLYEIEYDSIRTKPFRIGCLPRCMVSDVRCLSSGLEYIYGRHPGSNISFVFDFGTVSKKIAYGNNRADFTFIAGGVVPGTLVVKPDFPENKEDWPFLWGENEYVVSLGASYIYLVNAANELVKEMK